MALLKIETQEKRPRIRKPKPQGPFPFPRAATCHEQRRPSPSHVSTPEAISEPPAAATRQPKRKPPVVTSVRVPHSRTDPEATPPLAHQRLSRPHVSRPRSPLEPLADSPADAPDSAEDGPPLARLDRWSVLQAPRVLHGKQQQMKGRHVSISHQNSGPILHDFQDTIYHFGISFTL